MDTITYIITGNPVGYRVKEFDKVVGDAEILEWIKENGWSGKFSGISTDPTNPDNQERYFWINDKFYIAKDGEK